MALFKPADSLLISTTADEFTQHDDHESGDFHPRDFQVVRAAGFATLEQIQIFDRLSLVPSAKLRADQMWNTIGEWMLVASCTRPGGDTYLATSDPYGYRPIFYSLIPGRGVVLADSFRGVIRGLSMKGVTPQIDLDNYLTALGGVGPQFVYSTSNRTMAQEVEILPARKALIIRPDAVHLVDRQSILNSSDGHVDFDASAERGKDLAIQSIRAITRDTSAEHILHLSGGVDSRLILAHLVAAGLADDFTIRTLDPRPYHPQSTTRKVLEKDIEISDLISSELGLNWAKSPSKEGISVDFVESLHSFQSHSSNYHYNFSPNPTLSAFRTPAVTLRGGGGELLRSTAGGRSLAEAFRKQHGDPDAHDRDFQDQWLSARLTSQLGSLSNARERAMTVLRESLSRASGESFESRMNDFYMLHRNRAHFGQGGRLAAGNEFTFQILSNVHYRDAMGTLPFSARSAGDGVRSLFERLAPELLTFPFENPRWEALLGGTSARSPQARSAWSARFDAQSGEAAALRFVNGYEPGARGERWRFSQDDAAASYIASASSFLEAHIEPSLRPLLHSVHTTLLPVLRRQRKQLQRAVAIMASAIDVLVPVGLGGVVTHIDSRPESRERIHSHMNWSIGELAPPSDGWSNRTTIEHRPSLERVGKDFLLATANPLSGTSDQAQFAFYLKRDGKVVDRRWYTGSQHAVFCLEGTPGTYIAQSFIRPCGDDGPTIRKDSTAIVI